jgi:hypothetical protein
VLPRPIGYTGVSVSHGQTAGYLGRSHDPFVLNGVDSSRKPNLDGVECMQHEFEDARTGVEAADRDFSTRFNPKVKETINIAKENDAVRARYGRTMFGQNCLLARRFVEKGARFVTVNMFDTVFNDTTWDCHADGGSLASTLGDYKETVCPMFDRAYSALLEDLQQRGMLDNTLVVAMGEFGRTPLLNARGGRDHWPGVWSILFAGAGVNGGQVIGSSDEHGANPKDRPITPREVAASVYRGLGIDLSIQLPGPDNRPLPLVDAKPIEGLFR